MKTGVIACEMCEEVPAVIRIAATNSEGEVLDSLHLCYQCAYRTYRGHLTFGPEEPLQPFVADPYVRAIEKALDASAGEARVRDVTCPQCRRAFRLTWNDYTRIDGGQHARQTLMISGCPSGGIYAVEVACPHCDYREEL